VARIKQDKQYQRTGEKSELCLKVGRCLYVDGRMKESVLWLQESCEWRDRNLAQDNADRLLSQHVLAGAYQANGQVEKAVKLLEHVVAIRADVLAKDHPDRLASQHELACAYQANGQVKESIQLLERVIAICLEVLREDRPDRLFSERLHEDQLERCETRQAAASFSEDPVAQDQGRCQFNQAPLVSQAICGTSVAFTATSHQSPPDRAPKSSSTLKRGFIPRWLKGILKRGK
jgi:tetratricopeptide (TPR) repeat protein